MDFNHSEIEKKWQAYWQDNEIYKVKTDPSKPKYYVLDMFPYPSGAGLHVGHPLGYIASDIYARHKRMTGHNVLHPMGFDAFGLPAEEYALQTGVHPAKSTSENMARYKEQLDQLGISFDWSRSLYTCDPNYYKWTQWIFTLLFDHYYDTSEQKAKPISGLIQHFDKHGSADLAVANSLEQGFTADEWASWDAVKRDEVLMHFRLAYKKVGYVNWCEALGTVLANDQVKDGRSDRGNHPVVQKAMTQWYLRITAYAERLLNDLDSIEWSDSLKAIQSNWIGRSEGASVFFDVVDHDEKIEIFTTRPDTIYGATYMVLAPEHDLVSQLTTTEQASEIEEYIQYVKAKSEIDRMAEKSVTGAFTGAYVHNPFTKQNIPIWIGEYVLKDYGTGAIMAVPSDDERDQAFATKFGLQIIDVVDKSKYPSASLSDKLGIMINSGPINGMEVPDAIKRVCEQVEEMGIGKKRINYKLRDANFSRQRYWGEPFPIVYDDKGITSTLPLDQLPLALPDTDDFKPGSGGKSPLSRLEDWTHLPGGSRRETDVMPAVAGSSWYYLRYMDPNNDDVFASEDDLNYWQDVDLYIGGAEHAVAHLMYARFWHKLLFDLGKVPTNEPFKKLVNQGMITGQSQFIRIVNVDSETASILHPVSKEAITLATPSTTFLISRDIDQDYKLCADDTTCQKTTSRVPVMYTQYHDAEGDYLDVDGVNKYIEWNATLKDAVFLTKDGYYANGKYQAFDAASKEPFALVLESVVEKMSKSKYNVVNPDEIIGRYGADCFRMYEMFLGPLQQSKPWDTKGIDGVSKFLRKLWTLFYDSDHKSILTDDKASPAELKILHTAIKKVNEDIPQLSLNTSVSAFMICVNDLKKAGCNKKEILDPLVRLLSPFAPYICEELYEAVGHNTSVHTAAYPIHDEAHLQESSIEYPICINGKKKTLMSFDADASKDKIEEIVLASEDVQRYLDGKAVKKVIVVPKRMVNLVV